MNYKITYSNIIKNRLIKNIFGIGIFRVLSVFSNFLLIGLIFRYFSNEELNGIWLTVFSIISWLTLFDFGIGNGLRNKLTESISKGDIELSRKYITTTYILMIVPIIIIIVGSSVFIFLIDWIGLFNLSKTSLSNNYLALFIFIVVILYSINFYLTLVYVILHSTYQSYKGPLLQTVVNLCNLFFVGLLYLLTDLDDLILLGSIYISTSIIVLLLATLQTFKNNQHLSFNVRYFDKLLIKGLLSTSIKFLVLQLAIIILFNTDNLLISKYIGVSEVTGYQLINKILSIFTIILSIVLTPIWTLMIEYKIKGDFFQIKKNFKRVLIVFFILSLGVCCTGLFIPEIILIWVGETISIDNLLVIYMVLFTVLHMWCNMFQAILNGLNKLNVQVISYLIATIINIPVSIWLVLNTNLGVISIIMGTIISLLFPVTILPLYTYILYRRYS